MKKSFALDLKGLHPEKVNWKKVAIVVSLLWIVAQLVVIAWFWNAEQLSDWGAYIQKAEDFYNRGSWYPDRTSIYDTYIQAPGLVNWFILQLKIFGSLKPNFFFNLLMNAGILYNVWFLSKRFFSRQTAYMAAILFCLLHSNIMVVVPAGSEVPFLFLCLTAFSLCVSGKIGWLAVAGVLLALGNWIRPLAVIFLPAILLMMFLEKRRVWHYAALIVPAVCVCLLIGCMAKRQCGYFVFQSTTSGVNLIMTANDKANGRTIGFFSDTTNISYIEHAERLTFAEKDSIWTARAIGWIKGHPARYAGLYVKKLEFLYHGDTWPEYVFIHGKGFVYRMRHGEIRKEEMAKEMVKAVFKLGKLGVYYVVCLLFLVALVRQRKAILTRKGLVLLIWLAGTLVSCLFPAGGRYHYPYMFAIIIWAAYGIDMFLQSRWAEPENRENA